MHGAQVEEAAAGGMATGDGHGMDGSRPRKRVPNWGDSLSHICQTEGEANFASGSKSLQNEGLSFSQK